MKTSTYSYKLLVIIIMGFITPILVCTPWAQALTARQVIEKEDALDDGDTQISNVKMILINSKKNQRVRQIKSLRKDYGDDTKSIRFFLEPADVRDTAYLSYDWNDADKTDDAWFYLPALRKVKRVSAADKADSFMGSDFTYADMDDIEIDDWEYEFVKENVQVNGQDCWLVEAMPKKEVFKKVLKETGYTKRHLWIRKDIFYVIQAKFWVKKGRKIKYLKIKDLRPVDGIWTAHELHMTTTKKGRVEHSTIIRFEKILYNRPIADQQFSAQAMTRGF